MEIDLTCDTTEFYAKPGIFKTHMTNPIDRGYYGYRKHFEFYWLWFNLTIVFHN